MPELTARLIDITCETLEIDRDRVSASARFAEDLGADSMDCVELMIAIENAFGIEFADDDVPELMTIADVAHHIRHADAPVPTASSRRPSSSLTPSQKRSPFDEGLPNDGEPRPGL